MAAAAAARHRGMAQAVAAAKFPTGPQQLAVPVNSDGVPGFHPINVGRDQPVGGLDDTIENWNSRTGAGTGFKFAVYTPEALRSALQRALDLFRNREAWQAVQRAGMQKDFSWDASAEKYSALYRFLTDTGLTPRRPAGVV